MKKGITLLLMLFTFGCFGQQLTYKPVNPNFGGEVFNYQQLLSSANAQNFFKEETAGREQQSELDRFTENLNRQLLNQISRSLLTTQIGQNGLQEGTFSFGSLEVEIYDSLEGLVINILDVNTGEQSQIIVPNP